MNGQGRRERGDRETGDRWWGMCHSTGSSTSGKVSIRFGTYNIHNGRNGGLEAALRGMSQANIDLGILQETKITDGIYTRGSAGYSVIATDALSRHRGGVELFYRSEPHFVVEAVEKFGPNVIGFHLATGARRWSIVVVSSGARYTPTMYHYRAPVTSWNPITLGPNFSTASTTKCGSER